MALPSPIAEPPPTATQPSAPSSAIGVTYRALQNEPLPVGMGLVRMRENNSPVLAGFINGATQVG